MKTENGKSRDTGNIGYPRHKTHDNDQQIKPPENKNDVQHGPYQNRGLYDFFSYSVTLIDKF